MVKNKQAIIEDEKVEVIDDKYIQQIAEQSKKEFVEQIKERFPKLTSHSVDYWASRFIMLEMDPDEKWILEVDDWDDPREIIIKFYPTYRG